MKIKNLMIFLWIIFYFIFFKINLGTFFSKNLIMIDKMSWMMIFLSFLIINMMYSINFNSWIKNNFLFFILCFISFFLLILFFCSNNIIIFFLLFEMSLIPIFMIIILWGYQIERLQASLYLFFYMITFSFPLLISILFLEKNLNYNFLKMKSVSMTFIFLLMFMLAFLVKSPLYFFHLWLPKAHVEASISGSILLAGILLKLGTYGCIRIMMIMNKKFYIILFLFCFMSSILSLFMCFLQSDQKSLIAYASVNHMSMIILCLMFYCFLSLKSSLLLMLSHGIISSLLFLISFLNSKIHNNRLIFLNQGLTIFSSSFCFYFILLILFNFNIPPMISFFSEFIFFLTFLNWSMFLFLMIFLSMFIGCFYSIFILINSIHGKTKMLSFFFLKNFSQKYLFNFFLTLISLFIFIINFFF